MDRVFDVMSAEYTETLPFFQPLELGPMANLVYLIGDPATKEAAVIDPGWEAARILRVARKEGYVIRRLLFTHGHPDHVNAAGELLAATRAEARIHAFELDAFGLPALPTEEGTKIPLGALSVDCLHTPGHSPGSQCFRFGPWLFSGDTLFVDGCGRTDLPGGDPRALRRSLARLRDLQDDLILCPGHRYGEPMLPTLGDQKQRNRFLQ